MKIDIPSPKKITKKKKKPVVESSPQATAAIEMALNGALPMAAPVQHGTLDLMSTQALVKEGLDQLIDSERALLRVVVEHSHEDTFCENFHRIMETAKFLDLMYRLSRVDNAHVSLLLKDLTDSWALYQEELEAATIHFPDDEDEVEDDEDDEDQDYPDVSDEDGDDPLSMSSFQCDLDPRFLSSANAYVGLDVRCLAIEVPLNDEAAFNAVSLLADDLIDRGLNNQDYAIFSPAFSDAILDHLSSDYVRARLRIVPVTVTADDSQEFLEWSDSFSRFAYTLGVSAIGNLQDSLVEYVYPAGEFITSIPRLSLSHEGMEMPTDHIEDGVNEIENGTPDDIV